MVVLQDICFSYGRKQILKNLSFSVLPGECVVLAGPNGSGKSTAVSVIAGVLQPDSGSVTMEAPLGFVPQGTALSEDMTVGDNLRFFADLKGCALPDRLPFGIDRHLRTRVSRLSGGMKKQVSIACGLLGDPQIILLDEPCESLDVVYKEELTQMLHRCKEKGCAIIYVGHDPMEFVSLCDKVVFIKDGYQIYDRSQLSGNPADDFCFCKYFTQLFKS